MENITDFDKVLSQGCADRNVGARESLINAIGHCYPGRRAPGRWGVPSSRLARPELEGSSAGSPPGPHARQHGLPCCPRLCFSGPALGFHACLPGFLLPRVLAATSFPILVSFLSAVPSPPRNDRPSFLSTCGKPELLTSPNSTSFPC